MFEVSIREHFDAAHFLRGYQGRCENLHGHRYNVTVYLRAEELNTIGLVYDFTELKGQLKAILGRFDHVCLNDVAPFLQINPSAENIAVTIYGDLKPHIDGSSASIHRVDVWESPEACATYVPSTAMAGD